MSVVNHDRRKALLLMSGAAAGALLGLPAFAQDLPHVDEADPTAAGLGYKHDAGTVDATKFPTFKAGSNCAGCNLVQGKDGEAWRPCAIFPGKAVNAKGWCAAYTPKA